MRGFWEFIFESCLGRLILFAVGCFVIYLIVMIVIPDDEFVSGGSSGGRNFTSVEQVERFVRGRTFSGPHSTGSRMGYYMISFSNTGNTVDVFLAAGGARGYSRMGSHTWTVNSNLSITIQAGGGVRYTFNPRTLIFNVGIDGNYNMREGTVLPGTREWIR